MRLDILGSSGTAPQPGNPASGYLVRGATAMLWMDAGPGTYAALADHVDPETLDAVLLSHMHADHCSDLLALFHVLAYVRKSTRPLPVVVPEGAVARWRGFVGGDDDHLLFTTFDFREARSGESFEFEDITVKVQAARHSVEALAYRAEVEPTGIRITEEVPIVL